MSQQIRRLCVATVVTLLAGLGAAGPGVAGAAPAIAGAAPVASTQALGTGFFTGPDVSSWQHGGGVIDWGAVAGSGQKFAFIKATEGANGGYRPYVNPFFAGDFAGAGSVGLYRGAYHFARPAQPLNSAADQARQFVAVAGVMHGALDLPPVLDLEATGGLGSADLISWTATWLSTVQQITGRTPMIYVSPSFWATALANTTSLNTYPLWIARWTSRTDPLPLPGGWGSWLFWQYTSSGSIPGISGAVDISRFCCSIAKLAEVSGSPAGRPHLFLRNSVTTGTADQSYVYGAPAGGTTLMCDWNGDGIATPGVFVNGTWYLTDASGGGLSQIDFGYGNPGDTPVCGDWNGDGRDTPGIVRNGVWYLVNSLGKGSADVVFGYGNGGDIPVVGDWNGDRVTTPGVVRNGVWYLVNSLGKGTADVVFGYGDRGDIPVVGDWNGDRVTTPGVVRNGVWYLVNSLGKGTADVVFGYGDPWDVPVTGRWLPGGASTIGIVRPTF